MGALVVHACRGARLVPEEHPRLAKQLQWYQRVDLELGDKCDGVPAHRTPRVRANMYDACLTGFGTQSSELCSAILAVLVRSNWEGPL